MANLWEIRRVVEEILTKAHICVYTLVVKQNASRSSIRRRKPSQERAKVTVNAMLDAAVKLLKRGGAFAITTNRIAETAGVSIGSVYQYFPNKNALFVALHERHVGLVAEVIRRRMTECTDSSLEHLVESLVEGMVEVHRVDPELSELLGSEVPHRADGTVDFSIRFHEAFRAALAPYMARFGTKTDLDTRAFVLANMIDALGHAVVLRRPHGLSLARAKAESCKAILAYLAS
jgi:AcrR family transcriptional regulator